MVEGHGMNATFKGMNATFKLILLSLALLALFSRCDKEPEIDPDARVEIPDPNFLAALIEAGVDRNGDGEISNGEAAMIFSLDVSDGHITKMTGLEKFVNPDTLRCANNQLTTLDISKNSSLLYLSLCCNPLTTLDISSNTALEALGVEYNYLATLDVSNNKALKSLGRNGNQLNALDISNNTALGTLEDPHIDCYLDISNMPSLEEVCVWTLPFPPEGFKLCANGSPSVRFTTECSE
jgi:hypothetical protein